MNNAINNIKKTVGALTRGLNFIENPTKGIKVIREEYTSEYSKMENLEDVNFTIKVSTYLSEDFLNSNSGSIDDEELYDIIEFPNIPEEIKFILGSYGVFSIVKISASRRLTEHEVIKFEKHCNLKSQIRKVISNLTGREIPIITFDFLNENISLFFTKRLLGTANFNESAFIIGDHGTNIVGTTTLIKQIAKMYEDFEYISSREYFLEKFNQLSECYNCD